MRFLAFAFAVALVASACSEKRPTPSGASEGQAAEAKETQAPSGDTDAAQEKPATGVEGAFEPQVAGSFYTADPAKLRKEIRGFLDAADTAGEVKGRDVVALVSPHAGYRYSGPVAGSAYAAVEGGSYRTVVILSLNHRRRASKIALMDRPAYDTPLGPAGIDRRLSRRLVSDHGDVFDYNERMFEGEHSLEVQIPFIQVALPRAKIVPMIVAVDDDGLLGRAGKILFDEFEDRADVLFVASSDMSHHFPYDEAKGYDEKNLALLEAWKLDEWRRSAGKQREGMCGVRPVLTVARMFEGYEADRRKVVRLDYRNSGDTAGDRSSVVGYGALAFTLEEGMRKETGRDKDFTPYGAKERRELMDLAKRAVAAAARGESPPKPDPSSKILEENGAAFVTLKKNGHLRGCIGHVIARVPLVECVADVARSAAIHDSRFNPVDPGELDDLSFEISVLTAPEPIEPEDVVIGVHGLIMSRGGRSGLLLPQVPVEWGWDREEFLAHTCRKAHLPLDCWKDPDTEIKSFRAIVWGEDDLED